MRRKFPLNGKLLKIVIFPKCEPFNRKFLKFLEENLARLSSTRNFRNAKGNFGRIESALSSVHTYLIYTVTCMSLWDVEPLTLSLPLSHSLADHVSRHMKAIQFVLLMGAAVSYALFTFMCAGIVPYCKAVLFLTFILGGFFTNGSIPLFFEMAVETAYPVAEGITSGFLTISCNVLQLVFYIFPLLPKFGLKWINWCTFATYAACIPLLALWRERYYRSEVDDQGKAGAINSINSISQWACLYLLG